MGLTPGSGSPLQSGYSSQSYAFGANPGGSSQTGVDSWYDFLLAGLGIYVGARYGQYKDNPGLSTEENDANRLSAESYPQGSGMVITGTTVLLGLGIYLLLKG